ncbi:MAG: pyridoxal-phosphate dependent enzyme [bacterium]
MTTTYAVSLADVRTAAGILAGHAHRTPVITCASLDARAGAALFFKGEHLQKVGAFKFRGAFHAVSRLTDDVASRGVVTHSSGNHAQALALAALMRGIPAHVVMPSNAAAPKRRAVEGYGARVIECEPTLAARESTAARVLEETGATFIPPYDHPHIIAGQGTAALELLEAYPDLEAIIAPVGGGGLLAGTAITATSLRPSIRVYGAEPKGADDAARSFASGTLVPQTAPHTIADGLLTSLGEKTWPIIRDHCEDILTVSEEEILVAMRLAWERAKLLIEPSSAVAVAAAMSGRFSGSGDRIGVILSGGNVDLDRLPWVVTGA